MPEPSPKESVARRSFRLKVEHLEELARTQNPNSSWIPLTVAEFVGWSDPDRELTAWASPNIVAPSGKHADLRRRLEAALLALKSPPKTRTGIRRGRDVDHAQALAEVRRLAVQNTVLLNEKMELTATIARLRDSLHIFQVREKELVEQLNRVLPFDRQVRSLAPK